MKALGVFLVACAAWGGAPSAVAQAPLEVLHWWTSDSESQAAQALRGQLALAGVAWQDAAIAGGGGAAAIKVLNSRMLSGDLPDVAQLIGSTITEWADMGLVLPLSAMSKRQEWQRLVFPTVLDLVTYQNTVLAVPLGIHRINTLLYNRRLFTALGLHPPGDWAEFETVAHAIRAAGYNPLAWSDEAWQTATVFESVLLSEVGPAAYRKMVQQRVGAAWMDPGVGRALVRLRWLRGLAGTAPVERAWTQSADELMRGRAGMLIMGDWAKGELLAWGASLHSDIGCVAVPGTAGMHLYSVDTLVMLRNQHHREPLQEKMAETVLRRVPQVAYNRVKGSVPVRRDLSPAQLRSMDACARASWETFAAPAAARLPSMAHRMATDEVTREAVAQILWRYLVEPVVSVPQTQIRLASAMQLSNRKVQP